MTKISFAILAGATALTLAHHTPAQAGPLCTYATAQHLAAKAALDRYCASRTDSRGNCNLQTRQGQQLTQNYIQAGIRRQAACR